MKERIYSFNSDINLSGLGSFWFFRNRTASVEEQTCVTEGSDVDRISGYNVLALLFEFESFV